MRTVKPLVIVVDDQASMRTMLRSFLESSGFRVLTASSGGQALRICTRITRPITAMITDVQMPEMSGFDLATKAGELYPEMPILFMSGAFSEIDMAAKQRVGSRTAFLQKPFGWALLSSKLRSVMALDDSMKQTTFDRGRSHDQGWSRPIPN